MGSDDDGAKTSIEAVTTDRTHEPSKKDTITGAVDVKSQLLQEEAEKKTVHGRSMVDDEEGAITSMADKKTQPLETERRMDEKAFLEVETEEQDIDNAPIDEKNFINEIGEMMDGIQKAYAANHWTRFGMCVMRINMKSTSLYLQPSRIATGVRWTVFPSYRSKGGRASAN